VLRGYVRNGKQAKLTWTEVVVEVESRRENINRSPIKWRYKRLQGESEKNGKKRATCHHQRGGWASL